MLYKNISFKNLNLSDAQYSSSGIVLQDFQFPLELDSQIEDASLQHGQKIFSTRAKWRVYKISGRIIRKNPSERNTALARLLATIRPSGMLGGVDVGRLEWEDFNGNRFWTMASVYESMNYSHDIRSPYVDFTFSLFAENPAYFGMEKKTIALDPNAVVGFGKFSADENGVKLGFTPDGGHILSGSVVQNNGNFEAGVIISDSSGIENNFYVNLTNGLKYGVSGSAENRTINTTKRPTEIRDFGQISTAERLPFSTGFLLSPGENIIVAGDGQKYEPWQITISFYDTFI